jgi:hypothetical protein
MMPHDWKEIARMYRAVTRRIEVTVEPDFLPERSSVAKSEYFWSYTIVITNTGAETVQLQTRHWIIIDATGHRHEFRGEGVVGEQPVLRPGERRAAADRLGHHDRPLPDGEPKRRAFRDRGADIFARQSERGVELTRGAPRCSARSRHTDRDCHHRA